MDSSSNDSKEDTEVVYINERLTTSETGSESFQSGMALYSDTWNKTEANKVMEANDQEDIAEDNVSDEEASTPNSSSYVMKEDQYKDYSSTVWIFLLMGIAGIIFVILNLIGTLTFLNGLFPNVVMGALFLFFIYVGVSTYQKAKKIQSEIADEKQLTEQINGWLKEHLTKDYVSSLQDDTLSEELNYIRMTEQIKDQLMAEFGTQNEAYLDHLIEEYYSANIEEA